MPPLVSINLCCYNSEKFLEQTLQSIFGQTFTDWELVVINDGSKDSTDAIIRRHLTGGRNIVYHPQANAGLGASRNQAIELSRGKYIALIDHDDVWEPEKLAAQVAQMEGSDRIGLSYTDADVVDAAGRTLRRYLPHELLAEGRVLPQLVLGDFIACSTVMIRRDAIERVGAFDPALKIAEEYDLFLRIAEKYDFALVDAPLLKLRQHGGNASWDYVRTRTEVEPLLRRTLDAHPDVRQSLGRAVERIRLAGFVCTPQQAELLAHPLRALRAPAPARALAGALARLAVSLLPRPATNAILALRGRLRRRAATH
jgi:glycosyltransferase involved in cell wall biosynthesis